MLEGGGLGPGMCCCHAVCQVQGVCGLAGSHEAVLVGLRMGGWSASLELQCSAELPAVPSLMPVLHMHVPCRRALLSMLAASLIMHGVLA